MDLPGNAVGISDIKDYRECPTRMELGMRRHTILPDGSKDEPPEHRNWTNAYGSAVHDGINFIEVDGLTNDEAVTRVWEEWGNFLDPEDIDLLREDFNTYRGGTPLGFRLVAAEAEYKVPLCVIGGVQYYFRFRLDALYQSMTNPSLFFHRDYKSSKWRRTPAEVHKDVQMTSYNWGIFEMFPECETLLQNYEQLRFGNVPTSRNDDQRRQIKEFLIEMVVKIINDEKMEPKQNDFCRYCPLIMTCSVTERSVGYWKGTLAILAPMTKEGRKTKIDFGDESDEVDHLIKEILPRAIQTQKHLELFIDRAKDLIQKMPSEERERLGWRTVARKSKTLDASGLARIHEVFGSVFYNMVKLTRRDVEAYFGKPRKSQELTPQLQVIADVELEQVTMTTVVPKDD